MPKLQPSPEEERIRIAQSVISCNQTRYALTDKQLAKGLGICIDTYRKRRADPGLFTLDDIQTLAKLLKITPVQAASMVLGRDITAKEIKDFILL